MTMNFPPAYPLVEFLRIPAYVTVYELGKEQRVPKGWHPEREWELTYFSSVRSGDVDDLRDFISRQQRDNKVFLFKEPVTTTRNHMRLGHGNGDRRSWLMPLFDAESVSFYVNSQSAGVSVSSATGTASLSVVTFDTAPKLDSVVTFSYVLGYFCPMVFIRDVFSFNLQSPGGVGEIKFTLNELKFDYPEA